MDPVLVVPDPVGTSPFATASCAHPALGQSGAPMPKLARMEISSRDEMDATGHDESGWAMDRRVDLMLAN